MVSDRKLRIVPKIETFMDDSRYTHDEKLRLIDSGFCVLLEDYTLLNAWFQLGLGLGQLITECKRYRWKSSISQTARRF
eukprot:UN3407